MAELILNLLLFIVVIFLLDEELLGRVYRLFLVVSASVGGVLLIYPAISGAQQVRRVGGYELPGAVNNISTMLAVGVVIAVVGIISADNWRDAIIEWFTLPLVVVGVFLSASRAAIIGLTIASVVLVFISDISFSRVVAGTSVFVAVVASILGIIYDFTALSRFSLAGLRDAVTTRLDLYTAAIHQSGTNPLSIVFGGGMYRYSKIVGPDAAVPFDTIIYPHNYVISLFVHVGLLAAVLFCIAFLWNGQSLLYFSTEAEGIDYAATTTLLSLIVISMYVFTSGRVTRTFPLWFFLGISEFLYARRVLNIESTTQITAPNVLSRLPADGDTSMDDA